MEVFENCENKASDIHLMDFPFLCRICLGRGDLRLFEQEDYLLDSFVAIRNIDVRSAVNFPSNICNECVNELKDISLFIDISKYNDSRPGKNTIPKKENEYVAIVDSGTSQEPVVKTEKITEEYEEDIGTEKSEICRICLVASCLTPFEEKAHLMQLFQNITNIDLKAASNFSSRNGICNKCINKLESISWFISLSVSSDRKIESAIERNGSLKTENCLEGKAIEISSLKGHYMEFDNISYRKEVKFGNYSNESLCSYESKDLHTVVDIKDEIFHIPEAPTYVEKQGCDPSKNEFSTENYLDIIPKGLNGNLKAHFKCDCCEKSFNQKQRLKMHMLTHTGEKPFECESCNRCFGQKRVLVRHMLIHTGEKPFKCDSCEYSSNHKQSLKMHMLTHTGEKPFECDSCKKGFGQKSGLMRHMLIHTGEKPFRCDSCGNSFNHRQSLKTHMLTHTGKKPFQCDICEKTFSLKHALKSHMLTHTGEKPSKCSICQKGFSRKSCLVNHMLTHTGEKPFKCDGCEKRYSQEGCLKRHMLSHTGEKPFKCDICGTDFSQKGHLKRHMLTHTLEKPFKCDSCGNSFNRKQNLKRHILIHTGEKSF